jgi:alpha-ribazole phosphatase/probable phosphoglycerate mutase
MAVKRIVFIRPGETDWNRDGRWQGWVAVPLNELGRQQAMRLANYIRHLNVGALYTSDLRRAAETAGVLSERLGYAPIPDRRLRERNIGSWQGLTPDEMQAWYPDEYAKLLADPLGFCVPGGESLAEVRARMHEAFQEIVAQDKGETIGVISHTTAIHQLLSLLIPDTKAGRVTVSNTSVTTIVRDGGNWRLVAADDVSHLEGLESKAVPELEDA